jgi:uncharacterized protein YqjF (DUF2071 family)
MTAPGPERDPDGWIIEQHEASVLFLHWQVDPGAVRDLVPAELELDIRGGAAWVSASPHLIERARLRDVPPIPHLDSFAEVELRTYVRYGGVEGVWFLSLDSPGHFGNWIRRHTFHLPYRDAEVLIAPSAKGMLATSHRDGPPEATFDASWSAVGSAEPAGPGSIEQFLVERYSMFVVGPDGTLFRGDVDHAPWPLQTVEVEVRANTLPEASGLAPLGSPDLAGYAGGVESRYWLLQHLTD